MGVEIKLNLKEFEKMKEILEYLTSHTIKVGFTGGESNNGTKVSEYAFYVEFGCGKGNVPRPFFRNATKNIEDYLNKTLKPVIMQAITNGSDGATVLNTIGVETVRLIQESINKGGYAANKDSTLKRKKGSKPLVDTGTMISSVRFEIE